MADSQVPASSSDVEIQAVLAVMFTPESENNNPRSRATVSASRDSLKRMYTYKITPTYEMPGDQLASNPPLGHVAFYIPYADTRMMLQLSWFLQDVVSHCQLMLSQFPPTAVDRVLFPSLHSTRSARSSLLCQCSGSGMPFIR